MFFEEMQNIFPELYLPSVNEEGEKNNENWINNEEKINVQNTDLPLEQRDDASISNASSSNMESTMEELYTTRDDSEIVYPSNLKGYVIHGFCSFSKNAKLVIIGNDNAFRLCTTSLPDIRRIYPKCLRNNKRFSFAKFNYTCEYLAIGIIGGIIKFWRISDDFVCCTNWTQWNICANNLAIGVENGNVYVMTINPAGQVVPKLLRYMKNHTVMSTGIMLPDGKRAALGYEDGTIQVISLEETAILSITPRDKTRLFGHSDKIIAIDCNMNNILISISRSGKTVLSSAQTGEIFSILQNLGPNTKRVDDYGGEACDSSFGCTYSLTSVTIHKALSIAAVGIIIYENSLKGPYGKVYIWDIVDKKLWYEIELMEGVSTLVWARNWILFTGGCNGFIRCFNVKTKTQIRIFQGHIHRIIDLCISDKHKKLLALCMNGNARLFDISSIY